MRRRSAAKEAISVVWTMIPHLPRTPNSESPPALLRAGFGFSAVYCRWLRGQDLNLRPSGYEPDELPGCSTPRGCCLLWEVVAVFW